MTENKPIVIAFLVACVAVTYTVMDWMQSDQEAEARIRLQEIQATANEMDWWKPAHVNPSDYAPKAPADLKPHNGPIPNANVSVGTHGPIGLEKYLDEKRDESQEKYNDKTWDESLEKHLDRRWDKKKP